MTVRAGGLQQRFSYRVEAVPDAVPEGGTAKKRVLVIAAEDYTGVSPNRRPGYDVAPRYLQAHVDALDAAGYEVETFNVDAPPLSPAGQPTTRNPSFLGVLSHFDAIVWYSGDDMLPQERHGDERAAPAHQHHPVGLDPPRELGPQDDAGDARLPQRGRQGPRRGAQHPSVAHAVAQPRRHPAVPVGRRTRSRVLLPANGGGDDDLPGTAFQRYRDISNDTWQNYLGAVGRQGGYGTTTFPAGTAVAIKAGSIFEGMDPATTPLTIDSGSGNDPNQDVSGITQPRAKLPTRLYNWSGITPNEPLRQERVELDLVGASTTQTGGVALSTADTVTFGFGLEQVPAATRNELVKRAMAHLLPATPDTTAPSSVGFKYPLADGFVATTRDPVEVDVTAADERGDMKEVRLVVDGAVVDTKYTFPLAWGEPDRRRAGSHRRGAGSRRMVAACTPMRYATPARRCATRRACLRRACWRRWRSEHGNSFVSFVRAQSEATREYLLGLPWPEHDAGAFRADDGGLGRGAEGHRGGRHPALRDLSASNTFHRPPRPAPARGGRPPSDSCVPRACRRAGRRGAWATRLFP